MPVKKKTTAGDSKAEKAVSKKTAPKKTAKNTPVKNKMPAKQIKPSGTAPVPSCIVGIGASAGGLEALEGFIPGLPVPNSMAFVIIQHLAPAYKSIMGSLLAKHTEMIIQQIKDGMELEPNHIYMNPPDKDVSILNGRLYLTDPLDTHATRLPIDRFLSSLAEDQKERAVGIILSGTGTDGTLGLRAIKGEGGMTMAQEESQAKYDSMPRNAINTGLVDFVLPVEKMGAELARYVKHPYIDEALKAVSPRQDYLTDVKKIFLLIRSATGNDFSNYKQNTIRRRIERRMAVHQINRIEEYLRYLRETPQEIASLFKDMLIGVTNFFRDADAFDVFEKKIIPEMLSKKEPGDNLRIWVTGCATGEEAYSFAVLILEAMEKMKKQVNVQIFATDIDAEALDFARAGIYPESIADDVSVKLLKRYFTKIDKSYVVKKQVREIVVFAAQNLIKDPPFSRLDLVSCRNLLIYLDTVLQKKVIPLFHYTLVNDGILFLGTSESIGEFADFFTPVSAKWKIFRRKGITMKRAIEHVPPPFYETAPEMDKFAMKKVSPDINIKSLTENFILKEYAPACVLVNDNFDILYFQGKTDRYLSAPPGNPTFNILKMAREELRFRLSALLHKAAKQKKTAADDALQISYEGKLRQINLIVRPLPEDVTPPGMMMVIFEDRMPPVKLKQKAGGKMADAPSGVNPRIAALEQEINSTKEYLQTTIEELETSNEELKSTNEELQSTNEEMQSTNEEMETSREELQSTNEELETVNSELQSKVEELSRSNNDLNNLLASTDIGTIFLDTGLNISRFTPSAARMYNLIQADLGRPISDITTKTDYRDLSKDAAGVLDTLITKEKDILSEDGRFYHMRIMPYRTIDNVIDGIVITFMDITIIKKSEEVRRLATVLKDSNDAITVQEMDGTITAWNRGAEKMFGYTETEALRMNITQLVPPDLRKDALQLLHKIKRGEAIESFNTKRLTKDGRTLDVWLTITRLVDDEGNVTAVGTTERDITGMK